MALLCLSHEGLQPPTATLKPDSLTTCRGREIIFLREPKGDCPPQGGPRTLCPRGRRKTPELRLPLPSARPARFPTLCNSYYSFQCSVLRHELDFNFSVRTSSLHFSEKRNSCRNLTPSPRAPQKNFPVSTFVSTFVPTSVPTLLPTLLSSVPSPHHTHPPHFHHTSYPLLLFLSYLTPHLHFPVQKRKGPHKRS